MAGSYIECAVKIAGNLENFNNEIVFLCFQVSLSLNFSICLMNGKEKILSHFIRFIFSSNCYHYHKFREIFNCMI